MSCDIISNFPFPRTFAPTSPITLESLFLVVLAIPTPMWQFTAALGYLSGGRYMPFPEHSLWAKEHSSHVNRLTNSTEKHYLDFHCRLPRVQKVENAPNTIKEKLSPVAKMYIPLPPTQIFSQSWTLCFTQSPNKFCHPVLEPPGG